MKIKRPVLFGISIGELYSAGAVLLADLFTAVPVSWFLYGLLLSSSAVTMFASTLPYVGEGVKEW